MAESINDEFGIRKIYPTNTHPNRARPWFLGIGDWKDRTYGGNGDWEDYEISRDSNNDVIIKFNNDPLFGGGGKGRFPILALRRNQYPTDAQDNPIYFSEKNQSKLRKRGFMGTKQDWKNVEVTMYWRVVATVSNAEAFKAMAFSVRGGPHHSSGGFFGISPCWGTALYVNLKFDGTGKLEKELGHGHYTDGIYTDDSVTGGNIRDRWIGMKGIFYTKANGNPYIELWLDKNVNNDWEPIIYKEDDGTWFLRDGVDNDCSGERNEKITWGGPGVIFKLDGLTHVDMKWASVREIMPPEGWPLKVLT